MTSVPEGGGLSHRGLSTGVSGGEDEGEETSSREKAKQGRKGGGPGLQARGVFLRGASPGTHGGHGRPSGLSLPALGLVREGQVFGLRWPEVQGARQSIRRVLAPPVLGQLLSDPPVPSRGQTVQQTQRQAVDLTISHTRERQTLCPAPPSPPAKSYSRHCCSK